MKPNELPLTYCNPLPIPDIPEGRYLDARMTRHDPLEYTDYRSISDPSVIYWEGKWILYPSYAVAYVSEDFVHWRHVDIGIPELSYSPAVVCFRGMWYAIGHESPTMYRAPSPLGPFTKCGELTNICGVAERAVDGCFLADGDHLYLYWHVSRTPDEGQDVELVTGTMGVELDPEKPWQMLNVPILINFYDPHTVWQRMGEYHQNTRMGWIEGQWAFKKNGRYYLMYSGSGTELSTYSNGVLVSDYGPLSGFKPQTVHDPLTEKLTGLVRGAGHGSIVEGPHDTLWVFYTNTFCYHHIYERRISMDPLGIDENGELYCPKTTETPQYAPGVLPHPEEGNDAGLLPLTVMQRPTASSASPGRDALYACDESVLTWWQPEETDAAPEITVTLGHSGTAYQVQALRLIWRDGGMEVLKGIVPGPFRYVVEYTDDEEWHTLIDASDNTEDLCIDYRQFPPVRASRLRLRLCGAPQGITPCLVNFTAFGLCDTAE